MIDSLQLHDAKDVVTPGDWKPGDNVILPTVAKMSEYANPVEVLDLPSGQQYMRYTTV